jgi:hypothetical protein
MQNSALVFVLLFAAIMVVNSAFRLFAVKRTAEVFRSRQFWQTACAFLVGVAVSIFARAGILTALGVQVWLPLDVLFTGIIVASGTENLSSLHDLGGEPEEPAGQGASLSVGTVMNVTGTLRITE